MKMGPQRGLLVAVSTIAIALLLLGQSCDASRLCASDRRLDSYDRESSSDEESRLRAGLEETTKNKHEPSKIYKRLLKDCGQAPQNDTTQGSIKEIERRFAPFVRVDRYRRGTCGGVILSPSLVLTFGMCLKGTNFPDAYGPSPGKVRLNYVGPSYLSETIDISQVCRSRHLTVYRLEREIKFSKLVHSACLPTAELEEGAHADVLGFEQRPIPSGGKGRWLLPVERKSCGSMHGELGSVASRMCLHRRDNEKFQRADLLNGAPVIALQDGKSTVFGIVDCRDTDDETEFAKSTRGVFTDFFEDLFKHRDSLAKLIDQCGW